MAPHKRHPPGSRSTKQWLPFAARVYSVTVFTLAAFMVTILVAFPKPSMAEHLNSTIQGVAAELLRYSFLALLFLGGLIGWRPEVRSSVRFWISVATCTLFAFWRL